MVYKLMLDNGNPNCPHPEITKTINILGVQTSLYYIDHCEQCGKEFQGNAVPRIQLSLLGWLAIPGAPSETN